jgi:hypothetical protein
MVSSFSRGLRIIVENGWNMCGGTTFTLANTITSHFCRVRRFESDECFWTRKCGLTDRASKHNDWTVCTRILR